MKKIFSLVMLPFFLVVACVSSKITSTWKASDIPVQQYTKIMVLGLILDNDRSMQEQMENHLAGDLANLGYTAVTSLHEYGPKAFDKMSEADALNKLKNSGVDAVLTIVLLDKQKERYYQPGRLYYSPYGYYYNRFWGYRDILYNRIYEPGYYIMDTKYFWESNLYEVTTQKLVYSAQTQSFDPQSTESLGHEYGMLIVKQMVKENVLQDMKGK